LVRGIQRSQVHFDFVGAARENGRGAAGTEKPPGVVACFAIDRHRILRENRGSVKKGSLMLAAVETVTKADPVWESRRHNSDVAAQATAGEPVHAASPLKSSGRNGYNEQRCHCNCPLRSGSLFLCNCCNPGIGLALDLRGDRMFVTDLAGSIYSADLDGRNKRNFLYAQGNLTGIAYAEI